MTNERSCGGIIYTYNGCLKFLLVKMMQGHWSFPKGHQENNESDFQTALREINEETNMDVILENHPFAEIKYNPKEDVLKTVVYFIGKAKTENFIIPDFEIVDIFWASYDESLTILTYDNDKSIIIKANNYLNMKGYHNGD